MKYYQKNYEKKEMQKKDSVINPIENVQLTCQTTPTITEYRTGHRVGSHSTCLVIASPVLHILNNFG